MSNSIDILIAANKNYIIGLALTLKSLLKNYTRNLRLNFNLATTDINQNDIVQLEDYLSDKCSKEFNIHRLDKEAYSYIDAKLPRSSRFSNEANARLAIYEIFKKSEKVFYLDSDLFFYNFDFGDFLDIEMGSHSLAACQGNGNYKFKDMKLARPDLPIPDQMLGLPYLNSGVLIFQINNGLRNGFDKKLSSYLDSGLANKCDSDQFIINMVYAGDWIKIDERFNYRRFLRDGRFNFEVKNASVFHFVGACKPWNIIPFNDSDVVHDVHEFLRRTKINRYLFSNINYIRTGRRSFFRRLKKLIIN